MSLSNMIEFGVLLVLLIGGIAVKFYTRRKVSALDGSDGLMEAYECEGDLIAKYQEADIDSSPPK